MSQLDQHLTTEQLSTWLDQQLTPEEQAYYRAHLGDCERCQDVLDDLRQTVNLLRSLPQLEVPRSFALPADFTITANGNNKKQIEQLTAPRRLPTPLRRTLRTLSALAAVIGIFFALSGFVATLSEFHPSATSTSSASVPYAVQAPATPQSQRGAQAASSLTKDNDHDKYGSTTTANGERDKQNSPARTTSTATWPRLPLLDFNLPGVRLSFGVLLTILGSMGFTLFAQRLKRGARSVKRNL